MSKGITSAANTMLAGYWCSPKDDLVVVTMEQTMPFHFYLDFTPKKPIYDAILK